MNVSIDAAGDLYVDLECLAPSQVEDIIKGLRLLHKQRVAEYRKRPPVTSAEILADQIQQQFGRIRTKAPRA